MKTYRRIEISYIYSPVSFQEFNKKVLKDCHILRFVISEQETACIARNMLAFIEIKVNKYMGTISPEFC